MLRPRIQLTILALAVLCLAAASPASGATTRIGAVGEIEAETAPFESSSGGDTVQIAEAAGTYAVPGGYGVITAWEHRTGTAGGTLHFKVYRPTGTAGRFFTVASNPRAVTAGTVHTFAVRIPVRPGDRLGLSSATDTVQLAYQTFNPADQFAFLPIDSNPQPGTTVMQDGLPAVGYKVDVAARVETDADGDGFGDDSQDRCPTSATTQGACPGGYSLPRFAGCSSKAANVIRGTATANAIAGTGRADRIFAGAGKDRVDGLAGADCIDLGAGNDRGQSGRGEDLMVGGSGRDRLSGGSGNDRLNGGGGADRISGGTGRDRINARDRRRDRISCGRGRDSVRADRGDRVARDCELVRRR